MVYWVNTFLTLPLLLLLIVKMVIGALVYLSMLFVLWHTFGGTDAIEAELYDMVRQKLKLG